MFWFLRDDAKLTACISLKFAYTGSEYFAGFEYSLSFTRCIFASLVASTWATTPVAAAKLKTFHVFHPLAFPLEPENRLLIFGEFEEFHLHRTAAEFFIQSGAFLEARSLAAPGAVLAELLMQRDMLGGRGDKDCERSDRHRLSTNS